MRYDSITPGRFIDCPNRFVAHVEVSDKTEMAHIKHSDRYRVLLLPCLVEPESLVILPDTSFNW